MAKKPPSPSNIVRVSDWKMREIFNEGRYWARVQSGELFQEIIHEGIPDPDKNLPPGTRTVTIEIREGSQNGPALAHVHGFIEPGWIIGASGKLDPKRIWKDGILYRLQKIGG